ncbi:hypothetical protein ACNYS0_20950 [Streptomyces sp. BH034]|uniref:hypothetical protein n=1 Tax=Streptomyces sp. BH034 TaxID=3402626 RepID=UPI003BB7734F
MKRCTESFSIWQDGAPVAFTAGQLVDDKHPILKTHGHLFAEPVTSPPAARPLRATEQATADPGEARTLAPPAPATTGPTDAEPEDQGDEPYDPSAHTGPEVIEYLKTADADERARVLEAEAADQKRKGVMAAAKAE